MGRVSGRLILEAVTAIVPDGDVMVGLLDLQAHSLLTVQAHDGTMRYAYLELVRGYAARPLAADPDSANSTQAAHAAFYLALAQESNSELLGPGMREAMQRQVMERSDFSCRVRVASNASRP